MEPHSTDSLSPGDPGALAEVASLSDARSKDSGLIARYRAGDKTVIRDLYVTHRAMWTRVARRLAHNHAEADDLVAEAVTRTIEALETGGGPDGNVSSYVVRTMRNLNENHRRSAAGRTTRSAGDVGELLEIEGAEAGQSDSRIESLPEIDALRNAFRTLPDRWRRTLWLTEIEGRTYDQVGEEFGLSANSAAALSRRARAGLRRAYVTYLLPVADEPDCDQFTAEIVGHAAEGKPFGPDSFLLDHASRCAKCRRRLDEADRLAKTSRALMVPALLGVTEWGRRAAIALPVKIVAGVLAGAAVVAGGLVLFNMPRTSAAETPARTETSIQAPVVVAQPTVNATTPEATPAPEPAPDPAASADPVEAPSTAPRSVVAPPGPQPTTTPTPAVANGPTVTARFVGFSTAELAGSGRLPVSIGAVAAGEHVAATFTLPDGARIVSAEGWECAGAACAADGPSTGDYAVVLAADGPVSGQLEIGVDVVADEDHLTSGGAFGPIELP